eukprot:gnl/MRDRNA2_/MRDRNA2_27158_c0_seq1.p1 gnl/MRDRNA2_/MRDRNA2_27158_c0~~gnl/MRDRNA2_/MRDRNA2_27158_c0_seq1.p1  ORF type:complete len:461 (-),score=163.97 gnl/MRDRNA2_/MRDRNA2_27158_c0_seq1:57-1439(-)
MTLLFWPVLLAVLGVSPTTAARVGLRARLSGQAHTLRLRLSNLEKEVHAQNRHAGTKGGQHMGSQWDEAEDEMLKLREQVESTEEEARKSVELPKKSGVDMVSAPADSEGATKGELRAVEAKLESQQSQLDHLESMVERLVSASLPKAQNTSQPAVSEPSEVQPEVPVTPTPQDMEAASQEASDNLAKEIATDQGQGGLLTEDEVQREDKDYHTPAPNVQPLEDQADMEAPGQADHGAMEGRTEDTWQDFVDPGDDAAEADGIEEEPVTNIKEVVNMAGHDLQPLAPAEVEELEVPGRHSQSAEATSFAKTEKQDVNADEESDEADKTGFSGLVPLAKVEEQDSQESALPAFDDVDEEDTMDPENLHEIPLAKSNKAVSAKDAFFDNAEQLLKDDGSADALSPQAMGHVLADASSQLPGAVTLASPLKKKKQLTMVRPAGSPVPLFFGPPPKGIAASAPA